MHTIRLSQKMKARGLAPEYLHVLFDKLFDKERFGLNPFIGLLCIGISAVGFLCSHVPSSLVGGSIVAFVAGVSGVAILFGPTIKPQKKDE